MLHCYRIKATSLNLRGKSNSPNDIFSIVKKITVTSKVYSINYTALSNDYMINVLTSLVGVICMSAGTKIKCSIIQDSREVCLQGNSKDKKLCFYRRRTYMCWINIQTHLPWICVLVTATLSKIDKFRMKGKSFDSLSILASRRFGNFAHQR